MKKLLAEQSGNWAFLKSWEKRRLVPAINSFLWAPPGIETLLLMSVKKSFESCFQFYELTCDKCVCVFVYMRVLSSIIGAFVSELFISAHWSDMKTDHTLKYVWNYLLSYSCKPFQRTCVGVCDARGLRSMWLGIECILYVKCLLKCVFRSACFDSIS